MAKKFKFRYVNEIVGGFVLLVCLLLLAGVLVAGHAQHWFEAMYEIDLRFPPEGSMDLQKGAEVMLLGAKVGSVQDILVDDDGSISGTMRVRGPFMRFVRADSIALVKKKMVVTGDAYIELSRGTGAELPRTGGEIWCMKDTEIIGMVEEALDQLRVEAEKTVSLANAAIEEYTRLAANANSLLTDIRQGQGLPAKLLNDPALAQDTAKIIAEVQALMVKVNAMAAELQQVVAKLPAMADTVAGEVDNLPVVVGEAQTLMRETTTLLHGLQKHWLLRKYVESDDALRSEEVVQ